MSETETLLLRLADALWARTWMLTTAESCTGGLIAGACTERGGSSEWFERGFVTYSNAAKTELLGVPAALIATHGAVSEPVVQAMVQGALAHAHAQVAVAVTGIAGPTGATPTKPVGTVWLGWSVAGVLSTECHCFSGDRAAVRQATVRRALEGLLERLEQTPCPQRQR
jgi:nicotinamide-nucleotide amidase